jgi:creatinine amidohydrolase/Fe(II)-dependent formamide hydrolase-like protein
MHCLLRRAAPWALLLALVVPPALAEPVAVELEDLTWTELRDRVASGSTTILVPIGGTEQNGPAMTLGKHNRRVKVLAEQIAQRLGRTLVAPVIAYVPEGTLQPPTAHMRFPGTITIPNSAFEATLESAARSFRLHGFKDIVLLGDHGGYRGSLQRVADKLDREWRGQARVHALPEYYSAFEADYTHALAAKGFGSEEIGTHAGLADTALTLALAPDAVRADRLAADRFQASDGVHGKPSRATAELGRIGANLIVERSVEAIRRALAHP